MDVDDAVVEDVPLDDEVVEQPPPVNQHRGPLVNQTPEALKDLVTLVVGFVQSYGWYLVLGLIVLLYFKDRVRNGLNRLFSLTQRDDSTHRYDDGTAFERIEALEVSRRRLQEQMDAQAALHAEQMKKKQEEKRAQKIEDWERHRQGKGYRSKYRPPSDDAGESTGSSSTSAPKKKNVYRPSDYNPLLGNSSGGASYRPDRRGFGGGGGG